MAMTFGGRPQQSGFSIERRKTSVGAVPSQYDLENRGKITKINVSGYGGGSRSYTLQEFQAEQAAQQSARESAARKAVVSRQSVVFAPQAIKSDLPSVSVAGVSVPEAASFSSAKTGVEVRRISQQTGANPLQVVLGLQNIRQLAVEAAQAKSLQSEQAKLQATAQGIQDTKKVLESKQSLTDADVANYQSQIDNFNKDKEAFQAQVKKNQDEFARLQRLADKGLPQARALSKAKIENVSLQKQGDLLGSQALELTRRGFLAEEKVKAQNLKATALMIEEEKAIRKAQGIDVSGGASKEEPLFFEGPKGPLEFVAQTIFGTPKRVEDVLKAEPKVGVKGTPLDLAFQASKPVVAGLEATAGTVAITAGGVFERTFPKGVKVGIQFGKTPPKFVTESAPLLDLPVVKQFLAPAVRGVVSKQGVFVSTKAAPTVAFLAPLALEPMARFGLAKAKGISKLDLASLSKRVPKIETPIGKIIAEERASLARQAIEGKGSPTLFAPIVRAREGLFPIAIKKFDTKLLQVSKPLAQVATRVELAKIRAGIVLQKRVGVPVELAKATIGKAGEQAFFAARKPIELTEFGLIRGERMARGGLKTFKEIAIEPLIPLKEIPKAIKARTIQEIQLRQILGKTNLDILGKQVSGIVKEAKLFGKTQILEPLAPIPRDIKSEIRNIEPFLKTGKNVLFEKGRLAVKPIIEAGKEGKLFFKSEVFEPLKPIPKGVKAAAIETKFAGKIKLRKAEFFGEQLKKNYLAQEKEFLKPLAKRLVEFEIRKPQPLKPFREAIAEARLTAQLKSYALGKKVQETGIGLLRVPLRQVAKGQILARRAKLVTEFELGLSKGRKGFDLDKSLSKQEPLPQGIKGIAKDIGVFEKQTKPLKGGYTGLQESQARVSPQGGFDAGGGSSQGAFTFGGGGAIQIKRRGRQVMVFEESFAPSFAPESARAPSEYRLPTAIYLPQSKAGFMETNKQGFSAGSRGLNLSSIRSGTVSIAGLKPASSLRVGVGIKTGVGIKAGLASGSRLAEGVASAEASSLRAESALAARSRIAEATRLETKTIELIKIKTPKPFLFGLPEGKTVLLEKQKRVQGYNAFVKDEPFPQARYIKVTKNPLDFEAAKERGFKVADETISQTLEVRKAGASVVPQSKPLFSLDSKFSKKGNRYIEKRGFAIDTFGEKEKLRVSAFLARENKNKFNFGFGKVSIIPKKKKKRR